MPLQPHTSVRISTQLFEVLVRTGVAVSEAEHLTTLQGTTGTVVGHSHDHHGVKWNLVRFGEAPADTWLPAECCVPIERQTEDLT